MNTKAVEQLKLRLREMIEADRVKIVEFYFNWIKKGVERFLKARQPNLTIYEVYKDDREPLGIHEATTYDEVIKSSWRMSQGKINRPAFEVDFKPDSDKIILGLAEREVEAMMLTFLSRAISKLGPVVERKSGVVMNKVGAYGGFAHGAWVGHIEFKFDDGMKFVSTMKVITNFSKYNRPYGQYPMTFHDVLFKEGDVSRSASIEDIWASIGYVPPPPIKKAKWFKIVPGCVVIHEGVRVFIPSPSVAKKLGIADGAEQIARIEANETACYVEHSNGDRAKYKYTEEDMAPFRELEKNGNYNKASAARKQFAYTHFFPEDK